MAYSTASLPDLDGILSQFQSGDKPNQQDFSDLIHSAYVGRLVSNADGNYQLTGLKLDTADHLAVNLDSVTTGDSTLEVSANGLKLAAGAQAKLNAITLNGSQITLSSLEPIPTATGSLDGLMTAADKTRLDYLSFTGDKLETSNLSDAAKLDAITLNAGKITQSSLEVIPAATTSVDGLMAAADKTRLDYLTFTSDKLDTNNLSDAAKLDAITLNAGKITQSSLEAIPAATTSVDGLMASADKTRLDYLAFTGDKLDTSNLSDAAKLDAITLNAGKITQSSLEAIPAATSSVDGLMAASDKTRLDYLTFTSDKLDTSNLSDAAKLDAITLNAGKITQSSLETIPAATTSVDGLMAAADKTRLDYLTFTSDKLDTSNLSDADKLNAITLNANKITQASLDNVLTAVLGNLDINSTEQITASDNVSLNVLLTKILEKLEADGRSVTRTDLGL